MRCPFCDNEDTRVVDSRRLEDNSIKRRRMCDKCQKRFNTYERFEDKEILVIKKDNTREPFDISKIEKGIVMSCVKRPISKEKINHLVKEIDNEIKAREKMEISSRDIGDIVLNKLKSFDKIAYIRFASVYREFEEVEKFGDEASKL